MKPKSYGKCPDRMCGADDCPNCHPENFRGGAYIEDIEAAEEIDPDIMADAKEFDESRGNYDNH